MNVPTKQYDLASLIKNVEKTKNSKTPIYKGCPNERCFCTGACKEIVGWMPKSKTSNPYLFKVLK